MASPQVTSFGTPAMVRSTSGSTGVTGSWGTGQNRTAGHELVALVSAGGSTASAAAISTPAGWTQQAVIGNTTSSANAWVAVYTKTAAGSDSAPSFTSTLSGTQAMTCTLLELAAAADLFPVDTSGTYSSGGSSGTLSAMTATTGGIVSAPGEYAVTVYCQEAAAATNTWNAGSGGWSNLANDGSTGLNVNSVLHTAVDYLSNPTALATAAETAHWTTDTSAFGAGIIVVFAVQGGGLPTFGNDLSTTISSGGTGAPAAGTAELWTASSWSGFTASPTTTPPTVTYLADPAAPSELIELVNSSTGLVVRGVQGTTPVAHAGGFTVNQVFPAGLGVPRTYNVRDPQFGATGNGSTDDTAAIQAALDAARTSGGGLVWVPEGVYIISQSLQAGPDTILAGPGAGAATIRAAASFAPAQVGSNTGAVMVTTWGAAAASHIRITGLTIDGNGANISTVPGYADSAESAPVSMWSASALDIDHVEVINAVGYSVYLNGCTDVHVNRCRMVSGGSTAAAWANQDGIHFTNCSQFTAIDNYVDTGTNPSYGDDGIAIQSYTGCADGVISGNVIRSAAHGVALVCDGGALSNLTVTGNNVWTGTGGGLTMYYGAGTVTAASNVSFTNNTVANIGISGTAYSGIAAAHPFKGLTIQGNTLSGFVDTIGTGIFVSNTANSAASSDLVVQGNTVFTQPGYYGIDVGSVTAPITEVTVSGNTIDLSTATGGNEPVGIQLAGCTYGTVSGNTLYGNGDVGSDGIYLLGATEYISVTGNSARGFQYGAQESASGSTPNYNTYGANSFAGCTAPYSLLGANSLTLDTVIAAGAAGGIADAEQFQVLSSPRSLAANLTAQAIFNATTSGAVTVAGTAAYFFECLLDVTALSSSSHNVAFAFGGAATYTSLMYSAVSASTAGGTAVSVIGTSAGSTNLFPAAVTGTVLQSAIRGTLRVNGGGSIIPQLLQVTADAAGTVAANSYFRIWPAGSNTVTNVGNWS